ncbi:MAG: hypothetical protein JNM80_15095 [Phycisphaerae bacterium]|nr:hypothetical protein [Phycisphaerae bacterium]
MPDHPHTTDEFFVGYLPQMPPGIGRRTRAAAGLLAALALAFAVLAALTHANPGDAAWDAEPASIEGLFLSRPTPMILRETPDGPRTVLLVGAGKCGAFGGYCVPGQDWRPAADAFDQRLVRASGTLLHRAGRAMLELDQGPRAVAVLDDPARAAALAARVEPESPRLDPVAEGELVDAKCYLGAMKPGTGKAHRACAIRCIEGGVPAMIVDATGRGVLLEADDGRAPLPQTLRDLIGDVVRAEGAVRVVGDLHVLRVRSLKRR